MFHFYHLLTIVLTWSFKILLISSWSFILVIENLWLKISYIGFLSIYSGSSVLTQLSEKLWILLNCQHSWQNTEINVFVDTLTIVTKSLLSGLLLVNWSRQLQLYSIMDLELLDKNSLFLLIKYNLPWICLSSLFIDVNISIFFLLKDDMAIGNYTPLLLFLQF